MKRPLRAAFCAFALFATASVWAAVPPSSPGRFDRLVVPDPSSRLGIVAETPDQIAGLQAVSAGWKAFGPANGGSWSVWLDRRSGTPTLAEGSGIAWFTPGQTPTVSGLESRARQLVGTNEALFGIRGSELVLNPAGTGATDADHWVVVFDRVASGVPVEDERLTLYVTRGRLASFGANRWGPISASPTPAIGVDAAFAALRTFMGLTPQDAISTVEPGHLVFVAVSPSAGDTPRYQGPAGFGVDHALAWRFALQVGGETGTWIGKIDAATGKVIAFYDDDRYAQVKGGVYPVSNDQDCANLGCELPGFPMAFDNVTVAKKAVATDDMGLFSCPRGGSKNSSVNLSGPYVRISDSCGTATDSGNCNSDLDFGTSTGTDCTSPSGMAGDTHSARTDFYTINRLKDKARYWLPSNSWVNQQLLAKVNTVATCNAFYNGSVNFYRSGGGCRNTGEIAGVVAHEYGHGLDQNDGGGYDNPSEGYADVVSLLQTRSSCVGRGFFQSGACSGYGDSCLSCTGIRDMDFAQHVSNTPATPANFTASHCGGGSGPCGGEVHCEGYVPGEAIFDLATRDLPAAGLDPASAWQLAEKLYYKSRQGSGGNAYNCALPASDGCGAGNWFNSMMNADDDDGDLTNGTPHAAAIFAAFDRHGIACPTAPNQSTSSCPALGATTVTVTPGAGAATLQWSAVAGAARYLILRNDISCDSSANVIATVNAPATSYTDASLPSGFPVYYRVQPQGSNVACDGPVSACSSVSPN